MEVHTSKQLLSLSGGGVREGNPKKTGAEFLKRSRCFLDRKENVLGRNDQTKEQSRIILGGKCYKIFKDLLIT